MSRNVGTPISLCTSVDKSGSIAGLVRLLNYCSLIEVRFSQSMGRGSMIKMVMDAAESVGIGW